MCRKQDIQRSLASILGEIGLIRAAFGYSESLELYLAIMEEQVHKIFAICEKCQRKEVKHEKDIQSNG